VARLTAVLTAARLVALSDDVLSLDEATIELPVAPLWIPFAH
jgi:hypothetical protein